MKNNQFFVVTVLLSVVCASHVIKAHKDDILKPLHDKIKDEFINRSSAYVARQLRKNKPVSHDFQHFLDNDELMKKMKQSYGDGKGEFSFTVANKKNEIINDFQHKCDELNNENQMSFYKSLACGTMFCVSVTGQAIGLGVLTTNNSNSRTIGGGISIGALIASVGSWVLWSWAVEAQQEKQAHIAEITKIEEKWERNFVEMEKQKNAKHKHAHPHTTT